MNTIINNNEINIPKEEYLCEPTVIGDNLINLSKLDNKNLESLSNFKESKESELLNE